MGVSRVAHQGAPNMQIQTIPQGHGQPQRGIVTNTPRLPQQQMPLQNIPNMPATQNVPQTQMSQQQGKPQSSMPAEHPKHPVHKQEGEKILMRVISCS